MRFDRFTPEGIALPQFGPIPGGQPDGAPVRARFLSAHLLFAPGRFVEDVPYDPDLYFIGEEITLAIRAFTHGYDLFHPGRHVLWHEYTRKLRTKHWDDHVPDQGVEQSWHDRDIASLAKVRAFLENPEIGRFGCGTARSFAAYEAYAGLGFRRRFASRLARQGVEPGPPDRPVSRDWRVRLVLDRDRVPPAALAQPLFWYVGFHDDAGTEIARDDASRGEMQQKLAAADGPIVIERHFSSPNPPASWTVWPTDRRGRWLDRIVGAVDADCLMTSPLEQEPIAP